MNLVGTEYSEGNHLFSGHIIMWETLSFISNADLPNILQLVRFSSFVFLILQADISSVASQQYCQEQY